MQYPYKLDSMFVLNENEYPAIAAVISSFKKWDKRGDADSKGAAIFLLTYEYLKKDYRDRLPGSSPGRKPLKPILM